MFDAKLKSNFCTMNLIKKGIYPIVIDLAMRCEREQGHLRKMQNSISVSDYIIHAFNWASSKQGHVFWKHIFDKQECDFTLSKVDLRHINGEFIDFRHFD